MALHSTLRHSAVSCCSQYSMACIDTLCTNASLVFHTQIVYTVFAKSSLRAVPDLMALVDNKTESSRSEMTGTSTKAKGNVQNLLDKHIVHPWRIAKKLSRRPSDQVNDSAKHAVLNMLNRAHSAETQTSAEQKQYLKERSTIVRTREQFVADFYDTMKEFSAQLHDTADEQLTRSEQKPLIAAGRATVNAVTAEAVRLTGKMKRAAMEPAAAAAAAAAAATTTLSATTATSTAVDTATSSSRSTSTGSSTRANSVVAEPMHNDVVVAHQSFLQVTRIGRLLVYDIIVLGGA
jgi:hypothetical protein